jgi:long-chain acyl-CoA synthetase
VLRDGWLYTGDLGRLDANGCLTITGRSKEVIVLGNGKNLYPEEIEAHYRQAPSVRELCVLGVVTAGAHSAERLHAVVVPDLDVLRERRVVNVQELVRFELEGLSVSVPPHKRVLGFDVSMDPLPRTTTGKLKRRDIYQLAERLAGTKAGIQQVATATIAAPEPHVARLIAAIQAHLSGVVVHAISNFELDLGLDSMERVELLASLECRFGVHIPEAVAQSAFRVQDLADAFRDAKAGGSAAGLVWADLLVQGGVSDGLKAVLRPRLLAAPLLFAVARGVAMAAARPRVLGLEHVPTEGAFIVSPNHQSYLDPFLVGPALPYQAFRRLFLVGAAEYFQTSFMRWVARQLNVVPVDPDANLLPAMQVAAGGLMRDRVLMLFPEGERSIDGTPKKFKRGAAILASRLSVPIMPVAICGSFDIWPRKRPVSWARLMPWSGHRVTIQFGAPIRAHEGESEESLTVRLRAEVERMWLAATPASERPLR